MTRRRGLKGSRRGRQLEVIVLRSEGLSLRQIAQRLGCSVGTVKSQTARGLDKLRVAVGATSCDRHASRETAHSEPAPASEVGVDG